MEVGSLRGAHMSTEGLPPTHPPPTHTHTVQTPGTLSHGTENTRLLTHRKPHFAVISFSPSDTRRHAKVHLREQIWEFLVSVQSDTLQEPLHELSDKASSGLGSTHSALPSNFRATLPAAPNNPTSQLKLLPFVLPQAPAPLCCCLPSL